MPVARARPLPRPARPRLRAALGDRRSGEVLDASTGRAHRDPAAPLPGRELARSWPTRCAAAAPHAEVVARTALARPGPLPAGAARRAAPRRDHRHRRLADDGRRRCERWSTTSGRRRSGRSRTRGCRGRPAGAPPRASASRARRGRVRRVTSCRASRCCSIPLRRGSGMKVKVLEAMASGVPVVTTPPGAEGIEPTDGVFVLERAADARRGGCRAPARRVRRAGSAARRRGRISSALRAAAGDRAARGALPADGGRRRRAGAGARGATAARRGRCLADRSLAARGLGDASPATLARRSPNVTTTASEQVEVPPAAQTL